MRSNPAVCLVLAAALGGCSGGPSIWSAGFEPAQGVPRRGAAGPARVEPAVYAALEANPGLPGHVVVGVSRARSERLPPDWAGPGSPLAAQARRVGADLVRAAERYAGNEKRLKAVRAPAPGPVGAVGASGSPALRPGDAGAAVEVEVAVYDYLAVFYRAAGP